MRFQPHSFSAGRALTLPALLLLNISFLFGCSSKKAILLHQEPAQGNSVAYAIDGLSNDWNLEKTALLRDELMNFHAATDQQNLYLFVDIKAEFYKAALSRSGFTIYLSNDEDNKRARGVTYPAGAFNLLRDDPNFYDEFLSSPDWIQSPANQDLLKELERDIYDLTMVSEKSDGKQKAQFGTYALERITSEGTQVAVDTSSRYVSFEWKIPLDRTIPFQLQPGKILIGFTIEPPQFVFREDASEDLTRRQSAMGGYGGYGGYGYGGYGGAGYYGGGRRQSSQSQGQLLRRALGEYDKWFTVKTP